jgi:hypothetical protein
MGESLANLLHTAIQDIKQGNLKAGEKGLAQVITAAPDSLYAEKAWIWLAETFDDPEHKKVCFENALKINRENVQAHRGLANLPHYISAYVPKHTQEENLPLIEAEPGHLLFMGDKTKQQLNVPDQ